MDISCKPCSEGYGNFALEKLDRGVGVGCKTCLFLASMLLATALYWAPTADPAPFDDSPQKTFAIARN